CAGLPTPHTRPTAGLQYPASELGDLRSTRVARSGDRATTVSLRFKSLLRRRFVRRDDHIVDINLAIGRLTKQTWTATQVWHVVVNLDRPFLRLGLAARPDFAAEQHFVAVRRRGELERVPLLGFPREWNRLRELLLHLRRPIANLQLLLVP